MTEKVALALTLAKRDLVDLIYRSTTVEGLGMTFPDTENILDNAKVNGLRPADILFVLNMRDAYRFLFTNLEYPDYWMLIREFNKIVGSGLFYNAGKLRNVPVSIGGTEWKPWIPLEGEVGDEINQIAGIQNAEERALVFFCYICRKQLFIDGNKRVAQLMANKVLISSGVGVLKLPYGTEDMRMFKSLLISFYESGDAYDLCKYLSSRCIERI